MNFKIYRFSSGLSNVGDNLSLYCPANFEGISSVKEYVLPEGLRYIPGDEQDPEPVIFDTDGNRYEPAMSNRGFVRNPACLFAVDKSCGLHEFRLEEASAQ